MKNIIIPWLLLTLILSSCYSDVVEETVVIDTFVPNERIVHDITGRVTDDQGAALSFVSVYADQKMATTDAEGRFRLDGVEVPQEGLFLIAQKDGFIPTGEAFNQQKSRPWFC